MSGDQLNAEVEQYLRAAGLNVTPPTITSDPLVAGGVPIEQLLRILGLAANAGDPQDNIDSIEQHAERDAITNEAAARFAAQDADAASELSAVPGQDGSQLAQQVPQMASGIAGAIAGALGGALQPLAQMPQQMAQGAQQAMQAGMGIAQQAAGAGGQFDEEPLSDASLTDEFDSAAGDFADAGGGGLDGGGMGSTAPTAMLGPPPIPSASTFPSSAPFMPGPTPNAAASASAPAHGVSGMPMVPPGAMRADGPEKDAKAEVKRVSVPPVKNGAPVQGRITVPLPPPVTQQADGKPVTAKRIIVPKRSPAKDSEG